MIEDASRRARILESVHHSNHFRVNRTLDLVASKYYWPGLTKDVKQCVSDVYRSDHATHARGTITSCMQKASGSLKPISVPTKLWSQVGMDLIGPLPALPRGNQYIVTLTDYFTKWAEAAPLSDKTAHGVARFIYAVKVRPKPIIQIVEFMTR